MNRVQNRIKKLEIFLVFGISNYLDDSEDSWIDRYKKIDGMESLENYYYFTKEELGDMNNDVSIVSSRISKDGSSGEEIYIFEKINKILYILY